ncbi:MAG: homoserine dehydrogenase [Anaerolineaceae bacterium]
MKSYRLVLVGFGNVGKAFVNLLINKQGELADKYMVGFVITGIATNRHGFAIDPDGIPPDKIVSIASNGANYSVLSKGTPPQNTIEFINACPGDVLLENTPVYHQTGQPAIDHLKLGLERGMHAITANKGPVVHGFSSLNMLAKEKGKLFRFESAVMDGAPIFSLHAACLPASRLIGFHGILNSCTNLLLTRMETGESFDDAVRYAQSIGITETDPSADIDGWDATIKVAALATVLMEHPLKPQDINRQGIRGITPALIRSAGSEGKRWKLVCSARKTKESVVAHVKPEKVGTDTPLYSVNGTSSYIQFELDTLPGLGILESNPGPETTAYGLLTDLINIIKESE